MERYFKELYKKHPFQCFGEKNRETQKVARTMRRQDLFQSNRNKYVTSKPLAEEAQPRLSYATPPKEHHAVATQAQLYLKRFLEWKALKKDKTKNEQTARRGHQMHSLPTQVSKFAYSSGTFTPPSNLHLQKEKAPVFGPPKKQSLYVLVDKHSRTPNTSADLSWPNPVKSRVTTVRSTTKLHPASVKPQAKKMARANRVDTASPNPGCGGGAAGKLKQIVEQTKAAAFKNRPATPISIRMKAKINIKWGNMQKHVRNRPKLRLDLIEAVSMELPPNTPLSGTRTRTKQLALATSTQRRSNNWPDDSLEGFGNISIISPGQRKSQDKEPGTKSQNRGAIFGTKNNFRRFKLTYEEGNKSDDETALGADKLEDCKEAERHI
ncbi:guanylate kinase-associated protein mars-like [Drosophila obscura]|uniref:guanylate kinase-associated protein mars-like n=1 Tax=Drosophila obscura TaxID=7282 RepID=UPI001BB1BE9A|nr:guanylate kinase-associated protein mars-like [Drosophila obscura]